MLSDNLINSYNYWSDIVAGKINLRNGSKYDSLNLYNPNLLEYSIKEIKKSLQEHAFYHTARRTKNRNDIINGISGAYVFLSSFDSKVKTEIANPLRKFSEEYGKLEEKKQNYNLKKLRKVTKPFLDNKELQKLQKNNLIRMKKLGKEWEEIRKKIDKLELDISKGEIAAKVENNENFFVKVKDYFLKNWLIIIMATVMIVAGLMH